MAGPPPPNTFALSGNWTVGDESLTAGANAVITLAYHAAKVSLNVSGTGTLSATEGDRTSRLTVAGRAQHPSGRRPPRGR